MDFDKALKNDEILTKLFTNLCVKKMELQTELREILEVKDTHEEHLRAVNEEIKLMELNIKIIIEQLKKCQSKQSLINIEMSPERYNKIALIY